MFTCHRKILFQDTDCAGVMFFTNIFNVFHEAYETFLESRGIHLKDIYKSNFHIPIVHAEADYAQAFFLGDKIKIQVKVVKIGFSSFTLVTAFKNAKNQEAAVVKTVHVMTSSKTKKKIPIPPKILKALKK